MTDTALETTRPAELTPGTMLQMAFQKAIDDGGSSALAVAKEIIVELAKQRDYENELAFNNALRRIQDQLKPIAKNGWNDSTKSKFATSDSIDDAIDHLIAAERMTLTFTPEISDKPQTLLIVGVLSLGAYSRRYPLEMPADGQGPKGGGVMTRTHATGSAVTYGTRILKRMIFNLRFKNDDDGNKAGGTVAKQVGRVPEAEMRIMLDKIEGARDLTELQVKYSDALRVAEGIGDGEAIRVIINKKTRTLEGLRKPAAGGTK